MTDAARPLVPVRLARSVPRLLLVAGWRLAVGAIGLATGLLTSGTVGAALSVTGGLVLVYSLGVLVYLLTVRTDASPSAIRVRWALGSRTYRLVPGPITRIRNPRRRGYTMLANLGGFGVMVGPARIEDEELAAVLALGGTRSLIVVATAVGRLALGVEDEQGLLSAIALSPNAG